MAIDATVSGHSSNSYVTMAEADAYMLNNPYATNWASEEHYLIYAATMLDALAVWDGWKTDPYQAREFPRVGLHVKVNEYPPNYDTSHTILGSGILDTVVPQELKSAQCELAIYFKNNTSVLPEGVWNKRLEIGAIRIDTEAFKAGQQDSLPPLVSFIIQKYGKARASGNTLYQARVSRG